MALFHFLLISLCIACREIDARSKTLLNEQDQFIASDSTLGQVGNDFDCIDINKQPALQHPLLKNHKIQIFPTFAKSNVQSRPSYDGECPAGKVPIYKKTKRYQIVTNSSSKLLIEDLRHYAQSTGGHHTVSVHTTQNKIFYGGYTKITAYNLSVALGQYSTSSVWLESGPSNELNSIHAGLGVRPDIYGDSQLRLTTLWTAFGTNNPGCSDITCPGFVQVTQDKNNAIGSISSPNTEIGASTKLSLPIKIQRDRSTGHWWLIIGNPEVYVGYWPKELFTHLNIGASSVHFGGQTFAFPNMLSPPMGSGRLPSDGYQYSALLGRLKYIDSDYDIVDVISESMKSYNDASLNCYDSKYNDHLGDLYLRAFLYGGPGGQCNV